MKRIIAVAAAASLIALFAFAGSASADGHGPTVTSDPATVAAEGEEHTFTVTGSGFTPGNVLFVLPCTYPGDPLTPDSTPEQMAASLGAITQASCKLEADYLVPVPADADGNFSVMRTVTVEANLAWVAGDQAQTEVGSVPILVAGGMMDDMDMDDMDMDEDMDMNDDMDDGEMPMGGPMTGFGGTAGDGGSGSALPLAAGLLAVTVLGGAAIALRRNN